MVHYILEVVWYIISFMSYVCRTGRCRVLVWGSWLVVYHISCIMYHAGWHKLCNPASRALRIFTIYEDFWGFLCSVIGGEKAVLSPQSSIFNPQSSILSLQSSEMPKNNVFPPIKLIYGILVANVARISTLCQPEDLRQVSLKSEADNQRRQHCRLSIWLLRRIVLQVVTKESARSKYL